MEAADGKNIRSVTQVREGDSLRIRVSDGMIDAKVEQVQQGDSCLLYTSESSGGFVNAILAKIMKSGE